MRPVAAILFSMLLLMQVLGGFLPRSCGGETCGMASAKQCCCGEECSCFSAEELPTTEPFPLSGAPIESSRQWLHLADATVCFRSENGYRCPGHEAKRKAVPIGFREPIFMRHRALLI